MKTSLPTRLTSRPFVPVTIISLLLCASCLQAQENQKTPPTKKRAAVAKKAARTQLTPQIGILVEYIKLDHSAANKLLRQFAPEAADAQELRDTLAKMTEKGDAELLETAWVRGESNHRSRTISAREDIYPTEYDPAEIPNSIGKLTHPKPEDKNSPNSDGKKSQTLAKKTAPVYPDIYMTSANPTAFETRNVGITLEVDPVISQDHRSVTISLSPEIVTRLSERYFTRKEFENTARGIEHISMPTFYTMKTTTQITAVSGKYNIIGFHTPSDDDSKRVIVLLRVDLFKPE